MPLVSVKTEAVKQGTIESKLSLNGKTVFLKKNTIVSPIAGYIVKMNVNFGDVVKKNDVLFEIQTKENKALENISVNNGKMDFVKVMASSDGIISELNVNETGGFVMEGLAFCNIIDYKDLVIQVNLPFEYNSLIKPGSKCIMQLADHTSFEGIIYQILPTIDELSQTQMVFTKPITLKQLPENLNLVVQFIYRKHDQSILVSRQALMTNETQSEFWVMKLVNDSIAIKIPVVKGIQNDSVVEIESPDLKLHDLIICEGAYSLADSTIVTIVR